MKTLRFALWTAGLLTGALSSSALACPTCGIGDRFGGWGLLVYGIFMAAPFMFAFGLYKYVRKLDRLD